MDGQTDGQMAFQLYIVDDSLLNILTNISIFMLNFIRNLVKLTDVLYSTYRTGDMYHNMDRCILRM